MKGGNTKQNQEMAALVKHLNALFSVLDQTFSTQCFLGAKSPTSKNVLIKHSVWRSCLCGTNLDWQKRSIRKEGVTTLLMGTQANSQRPELTGTLLLHV